MQLHPQSTGVLFSPCNPSNFDGLIPRDGRAECVRVGGLSVSSGRPSDAAPIHPLPHSPTPPLLAKITHATLLLLPRLVGFASHPLPHPRVNVICQAGAARCGHNGRIVEVDQSASLGPLLPPKYMLIQQTVNQH